MQLRLVRSGYRDEVTHELTLTVNYEATHARVQARIEEIYAETVDTVVLENPHMNEMEVVAEVYRRAAHLGEMNALAHDFEVVIVAQEIVSVSPFNPELFETYFEPSDV